MFGIMPCLIGFQMSPTQAQDRSAPTAETVVEDARIAYGPPPPKPKCDPGDGDEIVVCAEEQEQSQFRVQSSSDLDPEGDEALNDGLPRAPNVGGPGIFHGEPTIGSLCVPGLQKCPPPPAIMVDFTKLPEAPPGSDADRIARGLTPTGNEAGNEAGDEPNLPEDSEVQTDESAAPRP